MNKKTEEQTKKENADRGVPHPPPHEEEAKGSPSDDRLQSEIPQAGDSKAGGSGAGESKAGESKE